MTEETRCGHGALPGECAEEGCLHRREVKNVLLGLIGATVAAADQAQAMTDAELAQLLLSGHWSTIEVHEAGHRLLALAAAGGAADSKTDCKCGHHRKLHHTVNTGRSGSGPCHATVYTEVSMGMAAAPCKCLEFRAADSKEGT